MAILWCGGEDIDFSMGSAVTISTTAGRFRSGYGRCAIYAGASTSYLKSLAFSGGTVTSCWLSFRCYFVGSSTSVITLIAGLVDSATTSSGLYIGGNTAGKIALYSFDGATKTLLATESGTSWVTSSMSRFDIDLVNYGASSVVDVYCDGTLIIHFSGDCTTSGVTAVDAVSICGFRDGSDHTEISEIMVASEDTRAFPGLLTMALTGDGTTTDWTGVYSTINGTTVSDATPNYTNTNDLLQEFDVTNLPSGTFSIRAIKLAMRAAKAAGTPTKIALGYNEGGTVTVESDISITTAYATYEQLDTLNPRTSAAWDQSIIDALQITAKSRA